MELERIARAVALEWPVAPPFEADGDLTGSEVLTPIEDIDRERAIAEAKRRHPSALRAKSA